MKQFSTKNGKNLWSIPGRDSLLLAGLAAFSFALPLPRWERGFLVLTAAAAAVRDRANIERAGER